MATYAPSVRHFNMLNFGPSALCKGDEHFLGLVMYYGGDVKPLLPGDSDTTAEVGPPAMEVFWHVLLMAVGRFEGFYGAKRGIYLPALLFCSMRQPSIELGVKRSLDEYSDGDMGGEYVSFCFRGQYGNICSKYGCLAIFRALCLCLLRWRPVLGCG